MAEKSGSGALIQSVGFFERDGDEDGMGNTVAAWVERFKTRSQFIPLRGGETVLAGRLQGRETIVARVRVSKHSQAVTSSWMMRDLRTSISYNVRSIEREVNRQFISFTCESGVAEG